MSSYVDVHCHLTHEKFKDDWQMVIERSENAGLSALVVNGLEPISNRKVLEWAKRFPVIKPSLGIYPVDAVASLLPKDFPFPVKIFDVEKEIEFIEEKAKEGSLVAIGECGLDGHWLQEETFQEQERVFSRLLIIAKDYDLPVIIHSRKLEARAFEMVENHGNKKVIFHCYGGKTQLAVSYAKKHPWCFSIPANARKNKAFSKLLQALPHEALLTETDSPFLAPEKNTRNEPQTVINTIVLLAELKAWDLSKAKDVVYSNYQRVFSR